MPHFLVLVTTTTPVSATMGALPILTLSLFSMSLRCGSAFSVLPGPFLLLAPRYPQPSALHYSCLLTTTYVFTPRH